jgi:hypothetical protein
MESSDLNRYDRVNPEEIIIRLKKIIEYLQNKFHGGQVQDGKKLNDPSINRN